jgi:hypothetical protein
MTPLLIVAIAIPTIGFSYLYAKHRAAASADFIRSYMFPAGLIDKLGKPRPELSLKDRQLVARALRQFFLVYLKSGKKHVAMPSQVVDDLWHEFILYTRHYEQFCKKAFGQMMHHTPAAVLGESRRNNDGLRRTWWFACLEENINPRKATRLPLLFALDGKWNIKDGFRYEPDCSILRKNSDGTVYCGGDFYGGSDSGGSSGSYDFSGDSNVGSDSGCSGGCGGD